MVMEVSLLKKAGFAKAAAKVKEQAERKRRLVVAYENYRYVRAEKFVEFNKKLYEQTVKRTGKKGRDLVEKYDKLIFTPIASYEKVPPTDVLEKVAEASERGVFDALEVAHIESVVEQKDPIVFGLIKGCTDRFFIAQWDNDIRIEDLLAENEG